MIGGELNDLFLVLHGFFQFADQQGASEGWLEGGDEQAVIPSGQGTRHGAGGEPSDAVSDEPFPSFGQPHITTNLPSKIHDLWPDWCAHGQGWPAI